MRIACVLDSGFEDSEFRKPFDAFIRGSLRLLDKQFAAATR